MSERRVTTKRARSDAEEDSNADHNDNTQSHAHISSQLAARLGPVHARHRRAMAEQRSTTPSQLWRAVEEATREDERAYVDDSVRIEENVESSSTSNLNNNNNIDDDNNITQINVNELDWRQEPHLRQLELQGQTLVECLPFTRLRRTLLSSDARTPYRAVPHSLRSVNHWGQRKLMLSELEFLTRFARRGRLVVYAGAAPGTHAPFLASLFPELEFVLVDPAEFRPDWRGVEHVRPRVELRREFFTDELAAELAARGRELLFISDIRTADPKALDAEEVERAVQRDMESQMRWAMRMQPAASMHKFRLPWGDGQSEYLRGELYLPIWGPQTTTESRLVVTDHRRASIVRYDNRAYEQQMFHFNTVTRVRVHRHPFTDVPGLCRCYDCAAECLVLLRYVARFGWHGRPPASAAAAHAALRQLSAALSRHCSASGGRTLATRVELRQRRAWFDARRYDVAARRIEPAPRRPPAAARPGDAYAGRSLSARSALAALDGEAEQGGVEQGYAEEGDDEQGKVEEGDGEQGKVEECDDEQGKVEEGDGEVAQSRKRSRMSAGDDDDGDACAHEA